MKDAAPVSCSNEIARTEIQLDKIISALPVGILIIDSNEDVVYANPVAESLFGNTVSPSENFRCGDFISCTNRDENPDGCGYASRCPACPLLNAIRTILSGNENSIAAGEAELNRDGIPDKMWMKYHAQRISADDRILALLTLENITDEKVKNDRLLESEERCRASFMVNPNAVAISRQKDGVWIDVNPSALDMFGYKLEEVIGTSYISMNLWVDISDRKKLVADVEQYGEIKNRELLLRRKDGRVMNASVSARGLTFKNEKHLLFNIENITAKKQALAKIRNSEEMFRTVFEQATVGVAQVASDGKFLKANSRFCEIIGYEYEELVDVTFREITHPEDVSLDEIHIARVMAGEIDTFEIEKRYIHKTGKIIWIKLFSSVVRDTDGKIKYAVAIIIDMTEQRNAETALRESEERFRLAYQTSPDSINLNRLSDGVYIDINEGFTKIMGYTREDVVGKTSVSLHIWENPEDRNRLIDGLQNNGYVENLEARFLAKDGSVKDGLMSARILKLNGEDTIISITRDITERKKMEDHLHFLSSITAGVSDSIVVTNTDFEIIYVNEAAEYLFGYSSEELMGARPDLFNAESSEDNGQKQLYETISAGAIFYGESLNKRKDGATFFCEYKVMPLPNKQGEIYAYVGVQRDVTDKKQMEEQIRKSQKMESIGTLAGGIAHDFNNILSPIIGMSEMLVEDLPPDSSEKENAHEILKAGKRGSELVKQILAFSRQSEHELMPTRIQHILREVLQLTRSTIPTNIEIKQDIRSDCGLVMADPTQIHQIAMNIITNAYHAIIDVTEGVIGVHLRETEVARIDSAEIDIQPGRYVVLSVSDNGHGIPPDLFEKIFDPYFTTKEKGKGTGLGLAVVYGIVREHKGTIKVYSEVGKGTTFDIYLPLLEKPFIPESMDTKTPAVTGSERILLVDDEEAIAKLEKQMLERLGYKVTSCLNSMEALEIFTAGKDNFDLVITDMSMPHMTGDQLAKELLTIRPDIPVITCTGFSERIDEQKANEMGVKGLLMKPIVRSELARMVRKILDEAKPENQG